MIAANNSLTQITRLLEDNNLEEALDKLNCLVNRTIWYNNARAVCMMRLNSPDEAIDILLPIVYPRKNAGISPDVPDNIKLNLAEAMLLVGEIGQAISIIKAIRPNEHHKKLIDDLEKWKKSLSLFHRLAFKLGLILSMQPVMGDYPYGEL